MLARSESPHNDHYLAATVRRYFSLPPLSCKTEVAGNAKKILTKATSVDAIGRILDIRFAIWVDVVLCQLKGIKLNINFPPCKLLDGKDHHWNDFIICTHPSGVARLDSVQR